MNPYDHIGPGKTFPFDYPYLYPLPAAILALPFAWAPLKVAETLFSATGFAALAWVLTRNTTRNPQLWLVTSLAMIAVVTRVQWDALMMVGVLSPALGFLLAAKPTIGAALFCAYPSTRALVSGAVMVLMTLLLWPWWVREWLATLPSATHMVALVSLPGGPLVLLGLLRWRRPEARLLVALACTPHTPAMYDVLPLFLAVRRWWEGVLLSALTYVAYLYLWPPDFRSFDELSYLRAQRHLWVLYMPCIAMVLLRPNVMTDDIDGPARARTGAEDVAGTA